MATERYNPRASEPRWQKAWDEAKLFAAANDDPRPKYYMLEMFPYPSGDIHMGHVRNYAMGDVVARFRRAMGFNVLHPVFAEYAVPGLEQRLDGRRVERLGDGDDRNRARRAAGRPFGGYDARLHLAEFDDCPVHAGFLNFDLPELTVPTKRGERHAAFF
jgi:hypothetical protein